ncbi:MAG TPA: YbaK/EbsC family protein [Beutenbergiaceae bacterium]|nr:YbaK/EbsC family protein [Beutenbergiaceae bacterium]
MALSDVAEFFARYGHAEDIHIFDNPTSTVALAAAELGVASARIAKTIAFYGADPGQCLLVVAAGDARVANSAFRETFGLKAVMVRPEDVADLTGHPVGGVCPFVNPSTAEVYLDASLDRFPTVFPAAGSPDSSIELTVEELERYSAATGWVQVCKVPAEVVG